MSYSTGTAATTANLMDALLAFAVANAGMTEVVRRTETINSISRTVVCLSKSGRYWWFYWSTNEVRAMPATSSSGASWAAITGRPTVDNRLSPMSESFPSYHFFTEGTCVHAAIENSSGYWQHMSFGDITKAGTWTGGHYVCLQYTQTGVNDYNVPADPDHAWMFRSTGTGGTTLLSSANGECGIIYSQYNSKDFGLFTGSGSTYAGFNTTHSLGFRTEWLESGPLDFTPNTFNNRSPGLPMALYNLANASGASGLLQYMGYVPGIRAINIKNLNAKDLINTDWMVFPFQSKNFGVNGSYANSGNYGLAYKK